MPCSSALEDGLLERAMRDRTLDHRGPITTADRSIGAVLSGSLAARVWAPAGPVRLSFAGTAGQGFGFALVDPIDLRLVGYANDTVGEVMSGGRIAIVAPSHVDVGRSLIGNAAAYGATGGSLFVAGRAGQRFGVRNSGAVLVCEGAGKYAFEYMTGGIGMVLGTLAAVAGSGMTGGELFLVDGSARLHKDVRVEAWDEVAEKRARDLLERHLEATGSAVACEILAAPDGVVSRLVRVVPAS